MGMMSRKMRIIPTLPAECQVETLRYLWRSLRWVAGGQDLLSPGMPCEELIVIVRGEVQAILGQHSYIPLLPEGSFLCEYSLLGRGTRTHHGISKPGGHRPVGASPFWFLRSWRKLPLPLL